jgi:hypothetical protein
MTGYGGRLRSLEGRFGSGACPVCDGVPAVSFHTVEPGETVPPRRACESCGAPHMAFIVEIDTQQSDLVALDNNARAESHAKPLIRRRQYNGPR